MELEKMKKSFDSPEKWKVYLEQVDQKQMIIKQWFHKFIEQASYYFETVNAVKGWSFKAYEDYFLQWFLTEHGHAHYIFEPKKHR